MQGRALPQADVEDGHGIVLRAATAADQRLIRELVWGEKLNPVGLAWPNFLVAERHDVTPPRVVGIGQLRPHGDGSLELASLVVVADARGRGVGTLLVNALIRKADRPLVLMCRANKVGYYQRFGFEVVANAGTVPRSLRLLYQATMGVERLRALFGRKGPSGAFMVHPGVTGDWELPRDSRI